MKLISIINRTSATTLATRAHLAENDFERTSGLSPWSDLAPGEGMVIYPAHSITTESLTFPIDLIFIDTYLTIRCLYPNVIPGTVVSPKMTRQDRMAAIELPVGMLLKTQTMRGDMVGFGGPR